jgi:uncharacterized protein (TIGR03437 family)
MFRDLTSPAFFLIVFASLTAAQTAPGPTITNTSLSSGIDGSPYTATLIVTGGTAPYQWTLDGSLPTGLSLSSKGVISGNPAGPGTSTFGVTVQDAAGNTSPLATFSIVINPQGLTITTPSPLPAGIANVEYPPRILTATGGVAPYTFAIAGNLPPGMTFVDSVIGGTPTQSGSYRIQATVTDSAGTQASATLSINIRVSTTDLQLSQGSLTFNLGESAGQPPSPKPIFVQSSLVAQALSYTISVPAAATWLSVTGGLSTPASLTAAITQNALALNAGVYTTNITITCTSNPCSGKALNVAVTLNVNVTPARLRVLNDVLSFSTDPSLAPSAQMLTQQLQVRNAGGAALNLVSITCGAPWCSPGPFPASIGGDVTVSVNVNLNPSSLNPGSYRTNVKVTSDAGTSFTPVTLVIPRKPSLHLPASGAQFSMSAGGATAQPGGSFRIGATGGSVGWTATASSTPAWLSVSTPSGTTPGVVQYAINSTIAAGLAPKTYYGSIAIAANGVANSPQEFRVILTVNQAAAVRPQLEPGGVVLTSSGSTPVTANPSVLAASVAPVAYQAAVHTDSGGPWLAVTPLLGQTSASKPGVPTLTADPTGLAPGVYTGGVTYAYSGAAIRTVNVTFVVTAVPYTGALRFAPQAICSPTALAIGQTELANAFSAPTSWPIPIAINLLNNCGAPVSNAQVVATFTNGDPPMALPLIDSTTGLYAATWTPRQTSSEISINTTATAPGLSTATAVLSGAVVPNVAPSLNAFAILNAFDPLVGGALAPGTVVAMYGSNLAATATQPTTIPLPTSVSGTQVIVGGIRAPLYYAAPGQINAQIPFELDPQGQYQVVISANGALTTPQTIQMAPAGPGIAANPDTTIIAQHAADFSLVTAASPAKPGEFIVLYIAGMGATDTPVASGAGAPLNPLANTSPPPTLTIDSVSVPVAFSGLTPGLVGLYQIDVQLPAGLSNGNHQLTVIQASGSDSNSTLVPVHN